MPESFVRLPPDSTGKQLKTFELPDGTHVEYARHSPTAPKLSALTSVDLAAGASVDLNAAAVTAGRTGKLVRVSIAASVPLKAEIKSVAPGPVVSTRDVVFTTDANLTHQWAPPDKDWITVAAGGNFRVTLTNQDTIDAADVYVTVYWDEE